MYPRLFAAVGVVLLALLLWSVVFVVEEGSLGVLTRFGQVQSEEFGSGAHLKSPFDAVHRFDRRLITRVYPGESFLSQDQKALNVDFYIKWRLADAARYFQATGGDEDAVAMRLADIVRDRLKTAVAAVPLAASIADTRLTAAALDSDALRAQAAQLGVSFVDAQLQRVDLPDDVANSVYQRMQQSLVSQTQQLRDDGDAQAEKIRSDAEHRRAQILADATRESQRIRGDADVAAAAAYAKAYGANVEFGAFYRSMQAYKNTIGRDGDVLVIAPDGEFFKYLHSASGR